MESLDLAANWYFFDKNIVSEGEHLTGESQHKFESAATDLQNSLNTFADSIKDGIVAPIGELDGDLVGFITQDKQIGAGISEVIDSTSDAIIQATSQLTGDVATGLTVGLAQQTMNLAAQLEDVTSLIVTSTEVIFTAGQEGKNQFLQSWHDTMHDCLSCIASAYTENMHMTKSTIAAVMQALGAVINSLTTLFIDLSRAITYLFTFTGIALLDMVSGQTYNPIKFAKAASNHVNNVLSAHRAVINQVLGVVICVAADAAVDIASLGTATETDAPMDALILGSAEGAAETGTEASVAAAEASETAAQESVSAAQGIVDNAAKQLATATDDAAKQAAQQALSDAKTGLENAEKIEQETTENLLKARRAQQALKNVANSVKDEAKTFAQRALNAGKEKLESALESLKSFPKDMAKSFGNLMKSNKDIAEQAGQESETAAKALSEAKDELAAAKQAYLDSVGPDGEVDPEAATDYINAADKVKQAEAEAKDAQSFAKTAEKIANESKKGKAWRFFKNGFKIFKPMGLVMNVAFNFTMMISGYNQDEENLLKQAQQGKELQDLWQANTQTKLSTAQMDLAHLEETSQKQYAAAGNQTLGLALYQNQNHSYIDQYQQSIVSALAPIYVMQLMPQTQTGLVPGNTGTLWGLVSNYLNLYPSQSFYTTTTGRTDFPFAQEIAQAPRLLTTGSTQDKQWFNQRCIAIDAYTDQRTVKKPLDPLAVKINLQFLYTLESEFHVGIYMGGNYHDYFSNNFLARLLNTSTANIQSAFTNLQNILGQTPQPSTAQYLNQNVIDLNEPYLAKMLILYRNSANDPIKLGVYEHMGAQQWLLQQVVPIEAQLTKNHSYTLQATLNIDSLNVALYVDNSTTPTMQQIVKVTPLTNQRMYGIISSGAAIQWNQINPKPNITKNKTARPANSSLVPEIERGKQMKVALADALKPTFGTIPLKPFSDQAILFHQYLYASGKTDLEKIFPKNSINSFDFLIFGTNTNGTISNYGKLPNSIIDQETNVLISLITGHVFNPQGDIIKIIPNVWDSYKTLYGPFTTALDKHITIQQQAVTQALTKIKFGNFVLHIIDQTSLQAGAYVYSCAQTLRDSTGKPMLDYVIFTQEPTSSTTPLQLGLPPTSSNAGAILSLVTGNIYPKNTQLSPNTIPTATYNYDVFTQFATYEKEGNLQIADAATIKAAQAAYLAEQQASTTPPPPKIVPIAGARIGSIQQMNASGFAIKPTSTSSKPFSFTGFTFHPKLNIANRANQAAGAFKFQFNAPTKMTT